MHVLFVKLIDMGTIVYVLLGNLMTMLINIVKYVQISVYNVLSKVIIAFLVEEIGKVLLNVFVLMDLMKILKV
jgi:hypothetical protein